jgi:mono/diheme cytochrome c family protein
MINCAVTADANSANSANSAGDEQADSGKDNESLALPGDPMRGQQLTLASGCLACHSLRGGQATVGPTWYNLAETASQRVRGQSAAEYLYSSIVNPNAYVVQGYSPNVMPQTYGRLLSDSELADIAGYLLTLDGE